MDISNMTPDELREMAKQLNELAKAKTAAEKPEKPKKKRKKRALPKVLKPEQAEAFIGAIDIYKLNGVRDRAIIETLYRAGLRVSEVCNLRPADVDLTGDLFIQESKNNKDRHVPFGPILGDWLKQWAAIRNPEAETFFHTRTLAPLTTRHIQYICSDASRKSRVYVQDGKKERAVYPHALRHTCATQWLESGLNLREVQDLLGHEDVSTTSIYTHVNMKDLAKKIKKLDKEKEEE